jgi:TonB family protein
MLLSSDHFRIWSFVTPSARLGAAACTGAMALAFILSASAQQPAPAQPDPAQQPAQQPAPAPTTESQPAPQQPVPAPSTETPPAPQQPTPTPSTETPPAPQQPTPTPSTETQPAQQPVPAPSTETQPAPQQPTVAPETTQPAPVTLTAQALAAAHVATQAANTTQTQSDAVTEEELKQLLVGKALYLRGGYLENNLAFSEHGALIGHSPQGSYTLNGVQIDKVRLTKHKVELEGARYGLHFLGALPYEDPTKAVDRVRITPKKKVLRITIDREIVVTPKKKKENKEGQEKFKWGWRKTEAPAPTAATTPAAPDEMSEADQLKASIAAAPADERPADPKSVTTTTSPAHAAKLLRDALDSIFAQGLDERLMASMPDFWKLYYQAVAAKSDYRPTDPAVLRQNTVDKKARLTSNFEPDSNEFAQANGVAGMALYHAVIGADGKPREISVGRPIGFGLDENAVDAIRKATFEPAIKDGKPVPVLLDLVVQFRIYSKRTAEVSKPDANKPTEPILPGPYSAPHPPPDPDR